MLPIIRKTRDALSEMFPRKVHTLTRAHREALARHWGRLNLLVVIRHVPFAPVFVHCHECRWPVNPSRTHMATGAGFYANGSNALPATEKQMGRICEGVRRHMGVV